jgi:hypothetical protein
MGGTPAHTASLPPVCVRQERFPPVCVLNSIRARRVPRREQAIETRQDSASRQDSGERGVGIAKTENHTLNQQRQKMLLFIPFPRACLLGETDVVEQFRYRSQQIGKLVRLG